MPRSILILISVVLSAAFAQSTLATSGRSPWSASGGGTIPLPPNSPASYKPPSFIAPPTSKVVGPIPSFIYSTVSDRFLLVLRRADGTIVDATRARSRLEALLTGPEGESLRLDVIPLDGKGVPILGIPVEIGVSVAVAVGTR